MVTESDTMTHPHDQDQPLEEIIGKTIISVEYNGDYYTPFTLELDDGTHVYAGGIMGN